ncbi:trypsin-like peptidase domain-containing protein [Actinopolymorpha pittospori]|uniref:WD40 repeat protein n=1 Tax=Actinopolymorpha pittospori TaxID=648752 RepID=A0A927MYV5_9ACTN|nr:trypsin-like peptidase domain-containing protein [Actinopolymorpha pittospori]MBE1608864.1 WD40 repeat protein [Actinopolymorpha pittospori]
MDAVPLRARLVEVNAELPTGETRYGSGCIVAHRTVVTAAHVVAGAHRVWVRGPDKRTLLCLPLDEAFVGDPTSVAGPDLALVEIDDQDLDLPPIGLARVDRDSASGEVVDRCHAWGYPQFAEVFPGEPRSRGGPISAPIRETCDAAGVIPVGSGLVRGLLDLQVSVAPRDLPARDQALNECAWSGISGGPVTSAGLLLGVVSEHAPRAGAGSLSATPLTALSPDPANPNARPGVPDPAAWWTKLGVTGPDALAVLPPRPVRPIPPYSATLRSMGRALRSRMLRLEGRDDELAAINTFATSTEGYRWLVGGAFAGKTALMYHAVTATLPSEVDVVSYFLRRVASDGQSSNFLAAVIPQLAALCPAVELAGYDEHTYRLLWERAVQRAHDTGRHLLLVVDGLDEDLRPRDMPSVASLLPDLVAGSDPSAGHAHVHVTSRPHPELPADLADNAGHPLHHTAPVILSGSPGWEERRDLGAAEVDRLATEGGLVRETLGLLAAAAGPLSPADLADLLAPTLRDGTDAWDVDQLLVDRAGRSIEPVGTADRSRYQFAHGTLLEQARSHKLLAKPAYRERVHAWADTWQQAGWPDPNQDGTGTPRYLLDTYPATLTDDPHRLAALAGDVAWVNAAIKLGSVAATLAVLRAAATMVEDPRLHDLLAVVSAQQVNLQSDTPSNDPGYVLRQLCLQALHFDARELAASIRSSSQSRPDPGAMPLWTTVRSIPPALEVGTHGGPVLAVAVLPDCRVVTVGYDSRVLAWNLDRPGQPTELSTHDGAVLAVAVLPDGRILTGGLVEGVQVWHPDCPGHPTELGTFDGTVWAVAVLPDGRVVTGGSDSRVLVWHPDRPGQPTQIGTHSVRAVAVLPDGRVATVGKDKRVLVWNVHRPGQPAAELGTHDGGVEAVAVLPDGRVVTGGLDERVRVWQLDRPGQPTELGTHDGAVLAVAVLSEGRVVTVGYDSRVRVWHLDRPGQPTELGTHHKAVLAVAVLPDGRVVTGGLDKRVLVWSLDRPGQPAELGTLDSPATAVAVLPDGRVVTVGYDSRVLVWNLDRPGQPLELGTFDGTVWAVAVLPDGRVVTGGYSSRVLVWHPDNPGQPTAMIDTAAAGLAVGTSPTGAPILAVAYYGVELWTLPQPPRLTGTLPSSCT